jgi:hypothetical protein
MSNKILIALALTFTVGCASTHQGKMATAKQNALPLKVSAETVGDVDGAFQMVEVTLENTSDQWVRVAEVEVFIPPTDNKLSVVVGQDLKDWASAMDAKSRLQRHNTDTTILAMIAGGFLAGFSNNSLIKTIGVTSMIGGLAASSANEFSRSKARGLRVDQVPETHLQYPFSVPGTLPMKRWILFNKPSDVQMKQLVFTLTTVDGKEDTYEVALAK